MEFVMLVILGVGKQTVVLLHRADGVQLTDDGGEEQGAPVHEDINLVVGVEYVVRLAVQMVQRVGHDVDKPLGGGGVVLRHSVLVLDNQTDAQFH